MFCTRFYVTLQAKRRDMDKMRHKAALFDLDGVVLDTESQYTLFWGAMARRYHPEQPGLEQRLKGQTLPVILNEYFGDVANEHDTIVKELDEFQKNMNYPFIAGFEDFMNELKALEVKTAVVTSSDISKMEIVYGKIPGFKDLFDVILTQEDFDRSKPDPDCYLKAAARLRMNNEECVVFEDSINGLKSGRAAGMTVVGLATTNPRDVVAQLSDIVINNYKEDRLSWLVI